MPSNSTTALRTVRVAQVLGSLEYGGMQTLVMELMRRLDRARFEPLLIHFKSPNRFEEEVRQRGWTCRQTPMTRSCQPGDVRALARVLEEERVDLVHTHADFANFAGRTAALLLPRRVPLIAHYHGHYFHHLDAGFRRREAILSPHTDRSVACSRSVERFLRETLGLPGESVRLIINGLDLAPFEAAGRRREEARRRFNIPDTTFHILHTGRLEPHKAPERLLHALVRLGDIPARPWRATFVGGGSQAQALRDLAASLRIQTPAGPVPLAERVAFAGWSKDIADHLASADAFVLCSFHEGLPLSMVEALATGTPVIASDVDGSREVIEDDASGLLVNLEDPERLVGALRRLMDDPGLGQRLVEQGRRRARDFSFERFLGQIEALYEEVRAAPDSIARPLPRGLFQRWRFLRSIHIADRQKGG